MRKKLLLVAAFLLFSLSFLFLEKFSVSLNDIITLPLKLITAVSSETTIGSGNIIPVILFLVFQSAGIVLIGVYSIKDVSKYRERLSVLTGSLAVIVGMFFIQMTIIYGFYAIGFIASCFFTSYYFPKFYEEFRVWRYYRAGVAITKMSLLIISVSLGLGIFLQLSSDDTIKEEFYNSTVEALRGSIKFDSDASNIPGYEDLSDEERVQLQKSLELQSKEAERQLDMTIEKQIDKSPFLKTYINNIAIISAVTIFSALMFLRAVVSPLGGLISFVLLTVLHKKKKHHHEKSI